MKNIKKLSLLTAIILVASFVFSFSVFAHDDIKAIEENDKIFANIPWEYELYVYSDSLSYDDDDGNYLEFCVGENKFAPNGITSLENGQAQKVFEQFYLYDGDVNSIDGCSVLYDVTEKRNANGYSCYYLQGKYAYGEDDIDGVFSYYFNAYMFATKGDIFVVGYEDIEGNTENYGDLMTAVNSIVLNGTHFDGDKPEKNGDHDFSNSPSFNDVVTAAQGNLMGDVFADEGIIAVVAVFIVLFTIVPTLVLIIIAIVLISKYSKNKKKLKQYELTYGGIPQYNAYAQNYGGYGYNQPVNVPYQPPVNQPYQQNPVNQNASQTPSYVTNAVNNLEGTHQPQQPARSTLPREMQEIQNNNENKF